MVNKVNIKTLIIVPAQDRFGGVYNFYENLKPHLKEDVTYFYVGEPKFRFNNKFVITLTYFSFFLKTLIKLKPKVVVLNPSLNLNAILRDTIYLLISKIFRTEIIVFWRGWNFNNENYLKFPYSIVTKLLLKSDKTIVLYSEIGNSLKKLGYENKVFELTTMVSDLAFNYQIKTQEQDIFKLIFLSRVESYKGVYELLKAYAILKKRYPDFELIIAGNGNEHQNLLNLVKENDVKDVTFVGYVKGDEKYSLLASGNLFVFPSYSEGMPNSVLEAMAVGLPIVTTPVGGINDFFVEDDMGSFIKIKDVNSIVEKVECLYLNKNLRQQISNVNIDYACKNFKGKTVFKKLKEIINS
jgi:glycosyltransferase involved in cell wall biosynthesis